MGRGGEGRGKEEEGRGKEEEGRQYLVLTLLVVWLVRFANIVAGALELLMRGTLAAICTILNIRNIYIFFTPKHHKKKTQ
jgi:hypothetical protein